MQLIFKLLCSWFMFSHVLSVYSMETQPLDELISEALNVIPEFCSHDNDDFKKPMACVLLETDETKDSEGISGTPHEVKNKLRDLAKNNIKKWRVGALRIEKHNIGSPRSSAEDIFEKMSLDQAAERIEKIYGE